ncbi:hypothetical protein AVEN_63936-1, partial [Araneus ventricosus]
MPDAITATEPAVWTWDRMDRQAVLFTCRWMDRQNAHVPVPDA